MKEPRESNHHSLKHRNAHNKNQKNQVLRKDPNMNPEKGPGRSLQLQIQIQVSGRQPPSPKSRVVHIREPQREPPVTCSHTHQVIPDPTPSAGLLPFLWPPIGPSLHFWVTECAWAPGRLCRAGPGSLGVGIRKGDPRLRGGPILSPQIRGEKRPITTIPNLHP